MHEKTVVAKELIKAFYGQPQKYAYWDNCHNGRCQGLAEAQLYPEDFDGIVAGDPAYYLTHLQAGSEYLSWVNLKGGTSAASYIPPTKYAALHRAALDACDAKDGVKDNAIEDPTRCDFDPISIQCKDEDPASCLTPPQVETARLIYAGAKFADGTQIYSGIEPGSELLWKAMIKGPEPLFINNDFLDISLLKIRIGTSAPSMSTRTRAKSAVSKGCFRASRVWTFPAKTKPRYWEKMQPSC